MRGRGLLLVLVALVPALSGCAGDDPEEGARFAVPTDAPVEVPSFNGTANRPLPDVNDSGYPSRWTWRVGDAWDYRAPGVGDRHVRVTDEREVNGTRQLLVLTGESYPNSAPRVVLATWVDAENLSRVYAWYKTGTWNITYRPPAPDWAFHRNGSYEYREERNDGVNFTIRGNVWYRGIEKVALPWGAVEAARVEHRRAVTEHGASQWFGMQVRYPSATYGNDVRVEEDNGETYTLVGVRYGGLQQGVLRDVQM